MKSKTLNLTKYVLKPEQPRVRARIKKVLSFLKPYLLTSRPKSIKSSALTEVFGNQNSPQAARLRSMLLIQSGTYKPGVKSYEYTVKRDGYERLAAMIGEAAPTNLDVAHELYGGVATGTETPEYTEPTVGARRYHAIQNLPKSLRADVFKGWFDYDIEAAAPTLVYQWACKVHSRLNPKKAGTPFPSIQRLVEDRTSIRELVAQIAGLDMPTAKSIVIRLFFGAGLVPSGKQAIFRLVNRDRDVLDRLKADPFVSAFRREVSLMWKLVLTDENSRNGMVAFRTGKVIPKPATRGKQRMGIYLRLERQVIDAIEDVLRVDGVVPVLIHDGFMVRGRIDRERVQREVLTRTGVVIRLAEARVGTQDENLKDGLPEEINELAEEV
jgi:hypothetical protein